MVLRTFILTNLFLVVATNNYHCSHGTALMLMKRPAYEFSIKILDRVSHDTGGHFVFSPMSTWLQLMLLSDGARGTTFSEIWKVTRHHKMKCFRRKIRDILNITDKELKLINKRSSVIVVDKIMKVKKRFKMESEKHNGVRVLSVDFSDPEQAAAETNAVIESDMDGVITEGVYPTDFNYTVLLMMDTTYFRGDWIFPFNTVYTTLQPFYSQHDEYLGDVMMMNQISYYNLVDIPRIRARVLELPCSADNRVSMLVLLPIEGTVFDIFFSLKAIRLRTIFNLYKQNGKQLVNVKLPRFKIITEIDTLPELLYDMGVKRVFYPNLADLKGISNYGIYASLISQIADIEVIEKGITAKSVAEFLVTDKKTLTFNADRPFAFLIVDTKTEMILFAGSYSTPSLY
ncbi:PREDICTED: ovalbumin-related protein X-like [Papilio xuthus]|uniref:Ovalbumin-related protein X-like n=1 Tax=Papilio xuthus TaxID=66420 RepID=A0AAJ6Z2B5_PAPXU|nr:PREDICTED: ovalbumin-related protein X-like [Papilio xuthus]